MGTRQYLPESKKKSRQFSLFTILLLVAAILLVPESKTWGQSEIPRIQPSVKPLDLSCIPTKEELMAAGQLGGQLYPTAEIPEVAQALRAVQNLEALSVEEVKDQLPHAQGSNLSFGRAMQAWNKHEYKEAVGLLKKHVEDYPDSPWASEAVLHLGCEARFNGRYSESEEHFRWVIEQNTGNDHPGAKMLVSRARSRLAVQKVLQNNFEEALELFKTLKQESPDWRQRTYASHWIQRLSNQEAEKTALLNCGTQALAHILQRDGKEGEAREVIEMIPTSTIGYSLQDLKLIAEKYGYAATGLRLSTSELQEVPLPALVHINAGNPDQRGHYWILEKLEHNKVMLFDPQSGRRFQQSLEEFSHEWSGNALVFAENPPLPLPGGEYPSTRYILPGTQIGLEDMAQIYGGCCGSQRPETDLGDPGRNEGPNDQKENECGTPRWSVNMVNMNLYIVDVPLWNNSPIGPSVQLMISYNSQSATAYHEPFGNKWQFNYGSYLVVDPGGTVTIFMPDGRRDVYPPDGSGGYEHPYQVYNELVKITENHFELRLPDDTVYVYNIPTGTSSQQPFLVEIRDAYGQSVILTYNQNVQLETITDALGKATTLNYNADGLISQASDPYGRSASFEYDANRNLTKITDMGGYWTRLSYDANVYPTSIENARGKWEFYIEPADGIYTPQNTDNYPPPGEPMWANYRITVTNPVGEKEEYFYYGGIDEYGGSYSWYVSPENYIEYLDDGHNNFRTKVPKIRYYFIRTFGSRRGEIRKIVYPEGGEIQYGYDADGNPTSVSNSEGGTFSYTYNEMGRITSITDADDTVTLNYEANGVDLKEIVNGLGTISMSYNSTHDVESIIDRLTYTTSFDYNGYGQIISQTNPLGIITEYVYDSAHQLQQVKRDGKVIERFSYDPICRLKTYTDSTGLTQSYTYDNLNHLTGISYPDGKSVSYTYSSCCPRLIDSMTDRSGRTNSYKYDELKRLIEMRNSEGGLTRFVYDANGNLITLIDPNSHVTAFAYDLDDRLISKTYHDGKSLAFTYDSIGRIKTRTDARGIMTSYSYDANDNLTGISYSDGTPGVSYQYDEYDRLYERQDGIGTYQFGYNNNSWLESIDGPWEDDTISYQYDKLGRRITLITQGGTALSYQYDNLNRLTKIHVGVDIYNYTYPDDVSPLVQNLIRPNGSVTTYQYDMVNRLTELTNKNSSYEIISRYVYGYNAQDVRGSETITNGIPITSFQDGTVKYNYNTVNQLLSANNPNRTFLYDDAGNMAQGYTPEGYLFSAAYDAENRLTSIEYTDSSSVIHRYEYRYSGDDFLAQAQEYENGSSVKTTRFVRDGYLVVQERDGNNSVAREYAWGLNMGGGIGGLLNLKQGGQNYSYLYDGKGNVVAVLNSVQAIAATYTYDTFGNLMFKTGTLDQPVMFSTKRYNEGTGFSYYGYRFYAPVLGRWTTRDPLGEADGMNVYGFVGNNPVNWIDLLGLRLAVVSVSPGLWKGIAGHTFIISGNRAYGETDTGIAVCNAERLINAYRESGRDVTIFELEDKYEHELEDRFDNWVVNTKEGFYFVLGNNCSDFVVRALNEIGLIEGNLSLLGAILPAGHGNSPIAVEWYLLLDYVNSWGLVKHLEFRTRR